MKRRRFLSTLAAAFPIAAASTARPRAPFASPEGSRAAVPSASADAARPDVLTKAVPSTGVEIPVIGMGTWITFNVGNDPEARAQRTGVARAFFAGGGGLIDSSPMYGSSEAVVGHALTEIGYPDSLFSATKVWTSSAREGPEQVERSERLWGVDRFDLQQVHNLVAWEDHLPMLFEMKAEGRVRHVGITTSHGRRHGEMERIMETHPIDFVQLTYNVVDRRAEDRLLPLARERGIAVIANRPFRGGPLVRRLQQEPFPAWAREFDAVNWPQFLLKFIVSHPALTCAIPATTKVEHMHENMGAATGRLPDAEMRSRMLDYVTGL
ncbi:MAG: aldo/keto reductase [Rhodothermales bacterium]